MNKLPRSKFWLTGCLLAAVVAAMLTAAACGNRSQQEDQVAGASQSIFYGYVKEVNQQARVALIDAVELIPATDSERISQLQLTTALPGGSYLYNSSAVARLYPLADSVELVLSDFDYQDSGAYRLLWPVAEQRPTVEGGFLDSEPGDDELDDLQGEAMIEELSEHDQANAQEHDAASGSNERPHSGKYSGSELSRLSERISAYDHIIFLITEENGRITKIEELAELYY